MRFLKEVKKMTNQVPRRDFLKSAATAAAVAATSSVFDDVAARANSALPDVNSRIKIQSFNFEGVTLGQSRWGDQYKRGRDFYNGVSNDDILQGFRAEAGLAAPGKTLGGWCEKDSSTVFGQWLSGMSRMHRATGDTEIRDKASYLMTEFAKTVGSDGNSRMDRIPTRN